MTMTEILHSFIAGDLSRQAAIALVAEQGEPEAERIVDEWIDGEDDEERYRHETGAA